MPLIDASNKKFKCVEKNMHILSRPLTATCKSIDFYIFSEECIVFQLEMVISKKLEFSNFEETMCPF